MLTLTSNFARLAVTAEQKNDPVMISKRVYEEPTFKIHTLGSQELRISSKRITKFNQDTKLLTRYMLQSMYTAKGIGLAAPQVGIDKQLIVIDLDFENSATPPIVLINPEIVTNSISVNTYEEGCLSIPGVYLDVVRSSIIEVNFRDEQGRPRSLRADGLLARCIQHEMDHLKGILFVDRVTNKAELNKVLQENEMNLSDVHSL
uniref:Peptide deformylase n=1 Tax=Paulinella micropora TaxID=1928728 RepID=A0A385I100_9EUKA|nr:peptide deformylase [Paulinella micropora]AXY63568.1 peptide deformylase [Paulinella micropora]